MVPAPFNLSDIKCSGLPKPENRQGTVAIIIPALNPKPSIFDLIQSLREKTNAPLVVVNDGSMEDFKTLFTHLETQYSCKVLHHFTNLGKGRALKTAFNYCLNEYPDLIGCVSADCDGQHTAKDIISGLELLRANPDKMILGCRSFKQKGVPWKSRCGNLLTVFVFRLFLRRHIMDTQTGLRGIPAFFMKSLLNCPGERFEFETNMLIHAGNGRAGVYVPILEYPIQTCYLNDNRESHFRVFRDSMKIYGVILRSFCRITRI